MEEAHSPGRRVTGLRQTQKAVLAGRAERVFLAKDADPARTCRIEVGCAAAAELKSP